MDKALADQVDPAVWTGAPTALPLGASTPTAGRGPGLPRDLGG